MPIRFAAAVVAMMLVLVGCAGGDDRPGDASSATTDRMTSSSATASGAFVRCGSGTGIGAAPTSAEVTWTTRSQLLSTGVGGEPRCLLTVNEEHAAKIEWGGAADRVLLGDGHLVTHATTRTVAGGHLSLSRPRGTSVLVRGDGAMHKVAVDDGRRTDLDFLDRFDDAVYHPAGRHVVAAGERRGIPGIWIADNLGREPKLLVAADDHTAFRDMAFSNSGGLHFIAEHDGRSHLHRLDVATGALSTIDEGPSQSLGGLVVSPLPGGGVAWTRAPKEGCGRGLPVTTRAVRGGKAVDLSGTPLEHSVPVGFLSDGTFVGLVEAEPGACVRGLAELHAVRAGAALKLAGDVVAAAIRGVHAPPADPPASLPDAAPA